MNWIPDEMERCQTKSGKVKEGRKALAGEERKKIKNLICIVLICCSVDTSCRAPQVKML